MGKIKNIAVYCAVPMSRIWSKHYCLDDFKSQGYNLTLLDASSIFNSAEEIRRYALGNDDFLYQADHIIKVDNFHEITQYIQTLDDSHVVWVLNRHKLNYSYHNHDLKIFNRYKTTYFFGQEFITPIPPHLNFATNNWKKSAKNLRYRFKNLPLKPNFAIGSGTEGRIQATAKVPKMGDYVSLPSLYLLWERCNPIVQEKYILYVDEGANFSPDIAILGGDAPVKSVKNFYENINRLFDKCEDWLGMPVVIAASGKYFFKDNPFNGRKIIYGKTQNLCQHADLIIGHKSFALHQAIIDRTPILHVLDSEFYERKNQLIDQDASFYFNLNAVWSDDLKKEHIPTIESIDDKYLEQIEYAYLREQGLKGTFFTNLVGYLSNLD